MVVVAGDKVGVVDLLLCCSWAACRRREERRLDLALLKGAPWARHIGANASPVAVSHIWVHHYVLTHTGYLRTA